MSKIFNRRVVYGLYVVALCTLFVSLVVISNKGQKISLETPSGAFDILSKITLPVMEEKDTVIGRPYNNEDITIFLPKELRNCEIF